MGERQTMLFGVPCIRIVLYFVLSENNWYNFVSSRIHDLSTRIPDYQGSYKVRFMSRLGTPGELETAASFSAKFFDAERLMTGGYLMRRTVTVGLRQAEVGKRFSVA